MQRSSCKDDKKRKISKRAEIATAQIVLLIILITSFVIILYFFTSLGLGQTSEKELCHNSVVTRGSSILPADSVPLNCRRTYLCVTEDGSCEGMTNPVKEKVGNKEEVYGVLANELADCWWMFGEGEINYVGKDAFSELYCSICTQIKFDDSVQKIFGSTKIEQEDVYSYMASNKIPSEDGTYLDYLYGTGDLAKIKSELNSQGASFGQANIENQYYVMMGISSDISTLGWIARGAGAAVLLGLTPITGGWGAAIGATIFYGSLGAGAGSLVGVFVEGASGNDYLAPSLIEVNSEEFEALNCDSISTLS